MRKVKKPKRNKDLEAAVVKMRLKASYPVVLKASETRAVLKKLRK